MKSVVITEELYGYILNHSADDEQLLRDILKETEELDIPLIQISEDQGKFLYMLCRMSGAKRALEVGTLTGYSGIHIARGLGGDGHLDTIELEKKHAETAGRNFRKAGLEKNVSVHNAPAAEKLKELADAGKKYDFIFIDANKTGYDVYFEYAMKMSHKGTVIALDNMLKGGRVTEDAGDDEDLKAVQRVNDLIAADPRVDYMILTVGDGLGLAIVNQPG